jgi:lipoyl-dependent peroxiredoxin
VEDQASAVWEGDATNGSGAITTGALLGTQYGGPVGAVSQTGGGQPVACAGELIAAAHAASFSRALSAELDRIGLLAERITTTAKVTSEVLSTGWVVTAILLDVVARVPAASISDFIDASMTAKTNCLVCRLLNAKVSLNARLER